MHTLTRRISNGTGLCQLITQALDASAAISHPLHVSHVERVAQSDVIARGGFDPMLAQFDSTGALIGQNDDGIGVDPDINGLPFDTYFSSLQAPGDDTVSVMAFANFANGPNLSDGFWGSGQLRQP